MDNTPTICTYDQWRKLGRGVKKGSRPFVRVDGESLFDIEDTYVIKKSRRNYSSVGIGRRRRSYGDYGDYDDRYSSADEDYYFAKDGTFW
jgi:hypothetical protein